ncbi:MAG: lectin-like domain-containing protein [Chthoniobacteraceae bacterium]
MNQLLRPRASLFTRAAGCAILAASISALTARADISGIDPANFTLNANPEATTAGVPNITGGVLNLTSATNGQATSAYFNTAQAVDNFTASFTYDFLNGSGNPADGFTFILQNAGLTAIGGGGGAVGYEGINPSFAVKFNIYGDDGFGYGTNGAGILTSPTKFQLTGANPINVRLDYDGSQLGAKLTDSVTGATENRIYNVGDISSIIGSETAFVGFTGGTGGENAAQAISNFSFNIGTGVVAEPLIGFKSRQVTLNKAAVGGNTANSGGGTVALEIENITEGESLLNGTDGFLASDERTAVFEKFHNPFILGGDDFAVLSEGYVDLNGDGFDGDTGTFTLYVTSDDGFRLRLNDEVIGQFETPTGNSNITIPGVELTDGDKLTLTFFERGGGDMLVFRVGDATGAFVGTEESGILVRPEPVPEPGTATLLALGVLGLAMRRRRA